MDDWQPPADAKIHIVCAACRIGDFIAAGPRHFDATMRRQIEPAFATRHDLAPVYSEMEQGFIDQWGRFYSREDAMEIVRTNKQPFNIERNGGDARELYSEGLY